jgi:hypothetical protein
MRAALPVLGCAVGLETYDMVPSLRLVWVYGGCDSLTMLCLKCGLNGWLELPSEYADRGPGSLKPTDEGAGVVAVVLNGSTRPRRAHVNPQRSAT